MSLTLGFRVLGTPRNVGFPKLHKCPCCCAFFVDHLEFWVNVGVCWILMRARLGFINRRENLEIWLSSFLFVGGACVHGCVNSKMDKDALRSVFSDASRDGWSLRSDIQVINLSCYRIPFLLWWLDLWRRVDVVDRLLGVWRSLRLSLGYSYLNLLNFCVIASRVAGGFCWALEGAHKGGRRRSASPRDRSW